MTATGTGADKNLRAMTKERMALTAIGPAVTKVKEKRGAISKIAPDNAIELTTNGRKVINTGAVSGANYEIAPEETTELIADRTNSGAIFKIAPVNILKLITEALVSGAISKIAPQAVTGAITFLKETVSKCMEITTKPSELMIKMAPAAKI